jgi:NADPH:quinone reductase-like Zn-dependent oxidoreductase
MTTMTAISQDTLGGPKVLRVARVERPVPGPTEVLVRVCTPPASTCCPR